MHASYHDITSRIPTPPLWFDERPAATLNQAEES
jgi:hypothetical protein